MGLAVETQYHINGQASHSYWKLVTLPLPAHLFYCSHTHMYIYGLYRLYVQFSLQNLYMGSLAIMGSWLNECIILIAVVT